MKKVFILTKTLLFICLLSSQSFAQTSYTVSGFVNDATNGESLIGANIIISDLEIGASTNISGYFVIPEVPRGKYNVKISYIGYRSDFIELNVTGNIENLKLELFPEAIETDEIIVSADSVRIAEKLFSKPVSKINLTQQQVNQIPRVVEADLLRALQTMPGIVSLSDFSSALYVRGGTPDQNLYLIDGTDVYNPEHAFGIFSTFNTDAIKMVEVSKGGFSADYGGRLSSVLDVTNLDGNRNEFEGKFNLSLLSAATTLQTPIGELGSLSASFRRTYLDQTLAKWVDEVPDYYFYDGNIKAFFDFDPKNKLTISFFNSEDNLNYLLDKESEDSFGFDYVWGNTTASVNWKHIFSSKLFASFWITGSRFRSNFDMPGVLNIHEYNYLSDYAAKAALEYYATNKLRFKFGLEQKVLHFIYEQTWDEGTVDVNRHRQYTTAYLSSQWTPNLLWDIEVGARFNSFNCEKTYTNIDPRFSLKYRLNETSNLKLAGGVYHQYLNRIPRLFFSSIWTTADETSRDSESRHLILGYTKEVANILALEVEAYYKTYKNLHVYNQIFNALVRPDDYDEKGNAIYRSTDRLFNEGDGNSYGLEVLLRKDIGALTGWLSYSYSDTKFEFDAINGGDKYSPRHTRNHVVNFVLNSDIGSLFSGNWNKPAKKSSSKWLIGINFVYASGQPLTLPASGYYVSRLPDWGDQQIGGEELPNYHLYPGEINSYQLPDYMRMDFSLTWEKDFGTWSIAPYLQVFNIGNRKNIWFINYNDKFEDGKIVQEVEEINMLPILPSIGVNIKF